MMHAGRGLRNTARSLPMRRLALIAAGATVALVLLGSWCALAISGVEHRRRDAEQQRTTALALATSLRDESNNLTRFAQLDVIRAEPRFRQYFDTLLGIRAGTASRPADYDGTFWDRVLAGTEPVPSEGRRASLTTLLDDLDLPSAVIDRLRAGSDLSNQLALLETSVMDQSRGLTDPSARAALVQHLTDDYYYSAKGDIMATIARFTSDVDEVTATRLRGLSNDTTTYLHIAAATLVMALLWTITLLLIARRTLMNPVIDLVAATSAIGQGDLERRATVTGARELRSLARNVNVISAQAGHTSAVTAAAGDAAPTAGRA